MDENRKKTRVSEDEALLKSILEPLRFKGIKRNKENRGKDESKKGYDFTAEKDGKLVTIEVKGPTLNKNGRIKGIPDAAGTEFNYDEMGGNPKFKADYLLVIGLESPDSHTYKPKIAYLVPKEVVNTYNHTVKPVVRFASELKTKLRNAKESDEEIKILGNNGRKWEVE